MKTINNLKMLEAALYYAKHDIPVFPCKPNQKIPLVKWRETATTSKEQITKLWKQYPNANIGIPTGVTSFFVLDVDKKHNGIKSLEKLIEQHGKLPSTPCQKTGGGGYHYLFKMPGGIEITNSSGSLPEGIDVRGVGGYIIASPSVHEAGGRLSMGRKLRPFHTHCRCPVLAN